MTGHATPDHVAHPFAIVGAKVTDLDTRENGRVGVISEVGFHSAWIVWERNNRRSKVSLKRLRPPRYALHLDEATRS